MSDRPTESTPGSVSSSTSSAGCTVTHRRVGTTHVVAVAGTVDTLTVSHVQEAITVATGESPAALIVDLSQVDFLASVGMGLLIQTNETLSPEQRFAVVADGPATSRPLKLIGVADIVKVFATLDRALAAVAA